MQAALKQMSSRHIRLTKIINGPQAKTGEQEVISIVCSHSLLLRDAIEQESERGVGDCRGMRVKGDFPYVPFVFSRLSCMVRTDF